MKSNKGWLGRTLFLTSLFVAAPVWADEPVVNAAVAQPLTPAQILYENGKIAEAVGEWQKAEVAFRASMELEPLPKTAGHLGRVQVEQGKYVEGATNLEWFLQEDVEVAAEVKDKVRPTLTQAKKKIATVKLNVDPLGATVRIDGQVIEGKRVLWPQYLPAGPHDFEASQAGFDKVTLKRELSAGSVESVELTLKATVAGQGPLRPSIKKDEPKTMPTRVKAAWIVGGSLAGVAVVTWIGAGVTHSTMKDALYCEPGCRDQYDSRTGVIQGLSTTAVISGALGLGAMGYAIFGTLTNGKERISARVVPTPNGAVLVGTW